MKKVTKKSSQPIGFFSHKALCAANQVKPKILVIASNQKRALACKPTRPGAWPVKWQRLGLLDLLVTFGSSQK
jgi:hypothetical protein